MAVASLLLSFFALILPFGIAAIVMGHTARNRILQSEGSVRGRWLAFWSLLLAYLQIPVGILIFLFTLGLLYQFNKELSRHPEERAALVWWIKNGDPHKVRPPADPAKREQLAIEALRLVRARQTDYLRTHPDEGYAGRTEQLGDPLNPENELGGLIAKSRYSVMVERTGLQPDPWYVVLAFPHEAFSPLPNYCLDSAGVIYRYGPERLNGIIAQVFAIEPQLCPEDGERVEQ